MYADKGTSSGKILKALATLIPGDPDSYLTAEVGGKTIDSIQAVRNEDQTYHVELLRKGGNPNVFNGNRILACESVGLEAAIKLFTTVLKRRDASGVPMSKFKDITAAANAARIP